MAGALTANAVVTQLAEAVEVTDEEVIVCTVAMLSPVDGANNVLLRGFVMYGVADDDDVLTFQWYRAGIAGAIADTALGAAVGPAFTIDAPDVSNADAIVRIAAVDRGAGLTSGYALTVVGTDTGAVGASGVYADALLFD